MANTMIRTRGLTRHFTIKKETVEAVTTCITRPDNRLGRPLSRRSTP